ncbi:uncharacterized protein [Equus przewalskii]|uniref:Uncharacterized protein isoform X3 n=1 Tax=Equus przewalskii TaxID=9798 RepID=A0ABM4N6B8_EQUPR
MTTWEGGAKGTLSREAKRLTGLFKTWIVQRGFRGPFPSGMGEHGGSVSCCPQSLCWAVHPKSSLLADFYHHHPLQDLWWQSPVQVILWACTEKRVELEPTVKSRQTRPANFLSDSFNLSRNQLLYFSCDARGKPGNSDFAFSELQSFRRTWTPFVKADVAQHQVQAGGFLFTGSATKISSVPCLYKVTCFLGGG